MVKRLPRSKTQTTKSPEGSVALQKSRPLPKKQIMRPSHATMAYPSRRCAQRATRARRSALQAEVRLTGALTRHLAYRIMISRRLRAGPASPPELGPLRVFPDRASRARAQSSGSESRGAPGQYDNRIAARKRVSGGYKSLMSSADGCFENCGEKVHFARCVHLGSVLN